MAIILDWQKKLGYTNDPFALELDGKQTAATITGLAPLQERLNLFFIKDERFGTISADDGMGKSTLLRWLEHELASQKSHAQYLLDAKHLARTSLVDQLLTPQLSFMERKFGSINKASATDREAELLRRIAKQQRNVLLIDNAGSLNKDTLDLIKTVLEKTPTHVLFADTPEKIRKLSLPTRDDLKLTIPPYTSDQLKQLLHARLAAAGAPDHHPFSNEDIESLVKKSGGSPVKLFDLARERAMELSLKNVPRSNTPIMQASQASSGSSTSKAPTAQSEKPSKFFSIRVQKATTPATTAHTAPAEHTSSSTTLQNIKEEKKEELKTAQKKEQDADLVALATAVGMEHHKEKKITTTKPVPPPDANEKPAIVEQPKPAKPARATKHDKVVEQLAAAFEKSTAKKESKQKKPAKKQAKKKK